MRQLRNRSLGPIALAMLGAGSCAMCLPARAQPTAAEVAKKDDKRPSEAAGAIDTVVITAGKRAERQREVAGTVTVLQGNDLESKGVRDHEDLFRLAPGIQYNKAEGDSAVITIRGIGTSTTAGNFVQSTAGIYIEDVPFNDPYIFRSAPDLAPFDLQRVEVLRGPQGVLFGSSSMGGAVRYLFNRPTARSTEFSALATVSATRDGGTNHAEHVMANLPLGETGAVRFVLYNRDDAGVVDNTQLGLKDTNRLRQTGGRVLASYAPTKELSVTLMLVSQTTEVDDSSNVENIAALSKAVGALSPRTSRFDLASLQLEYDLGGLRLTSITSGLTKKLDAISELSRLARFYGPGARGVQDERSHATSQELRLSSGPGAFTWLAGLFYQRYTYDQDDATVLPAFNLSTPSIILSKAQETSLFFQGDYTLANGLSFGAGARAFRTENDVASTAGGASGKASSSESGVTPRASVKLKFGGDNLAYALVSKGYRFGGVNVTQFTPNRVDPTAVTPPTYDSDSLINYEVGLRLAPVPTLRLDATVFVMDWKNLQISVPRPGDRFAYTGNVGRARSQGLELALTWTPDPSLSFSTAAAWIDARSRADFTSSAGFVAAGTELPGTPDFQVANQASWRFAGPMQTAGRATLTHSYVGKSYDTLFKRADQGGYSLLDLGLSFGAGRWELSLFAKNVADKRAKAGVLPVPGFYTDYYVTRPRTAGASLRFDL